MQTQGDPYEAKLKNKNKKKKWAELSTAAWSGGVGEVDLQISWNMLLKVKQTNSKDKSLYRKKKNQTPVSYLFSVK